MIAGKPIEIPSFFAEKFALSPLVAQLLLQRGIDTPDKVERFLHPHTGHLHDPFLFRDMERAVARIRRALNEQQRILIYGDYDADGISSTSLLTILFRKLGAQFSHHIPHRANEGYGMNRAAIERAAEEGVRLIVTVDTGISAVVEIETANACGIDVIVTDHHEAPETLPAAYAILNPKVPGCPYPFKGLAGVGMALKLAQALSGNVPQWMLQYAAIGTVADMMPLVDENRVFVKLGLQAMNERPLPAVAAFLQSGTSSTPARMSAGRIGFGLAPRINASGRLDHADRSLHFLISTTTEEALEWLAPLQSLNEERQRLVEQYVAEAEQQVAARGLEQEPALVLADANWNPGVIGIVASRLVEMYRRPAVVFSIDTATDKAKGSGRAYGNFDLIAALRSMESLFEHYGGHQAAAGMTLMRERLPEFQRRMMEWLADHRIVAGEQWSERTDLVCTAEQIDLALIEQLELLEPYGSGNPQPLVRVDELQLVRTVLFGKQKEHTRLHCQSVADKKRSESLEVLAFQRPDLHETLAENHSLSVYVHLSINEWRELRKPQLILRHLEMVRPQVYDWRNLSLTDPRCSRLFAATTPGAGHSVAVVSGHHLEYAQCCDRLKLTSKPIWLAEAGDWPAPAELAHIRAVLCLTMPEQPQRLLQRLFRRLPQLESVYLMLADGKTAPLLTLPDFDQFRRFYQFAASMPAPLDLEAEPWHVWRQSAHVTLAQTRLMADVLVDVALMSSTDGSYALAPADGKKQSLHLSPRFQEIERAQLDRAHLATCTAAQLAEYVLLMKSRTEESL